MIFDGKTAPPPGVAALLSFILSRSRSTFSFFCHTNRDISITKIVSFYRWIMNVSWRIMILMILVDWRIIMFIYKLTFSDLVLKSALRWITLSGAIWWSRYTIKLLAQCVSQIMNSLSKFMNCESKMMNSGFKSDEFWN